jgi:hypothetical protein
MSTVAARKRQKGLRSMETPGGNGARQKAWRARQRRGAAVYRVEAGHAVLNLLVDLGWLQEDESVDRRQVAEAIGALLADSARHHHANKP